MPRGYKKNHIFKNYNFFVLRFLFVVLLYAFYFLPTDQPTQRKRFPIFHPYQTAKNAHITHERKSQAKHPHHQRKTHTNENKRLKIHDRIKPQYQTRTPKNRHQKSESKRHHPQPQHCKRTAYQKIMIFKNNKILYTARPEHQKISIFKNDIKLIQLHESPPKNSNI